MRAARPRLTLSAATTAGVGRRHRRVGLLLGLLAMGRGRHEAVARDELRRQLRLRWRLLREVQQRASTGAEVVVVLVGRPDAARGEELMGRHLGQGFRQQPAEAAMRRRVVEIALWRRRRLRGRRDVRR